MCVVTLVTASQLQLAGEQNVYRTDPIMAASVLCDGRYTRGVLAHGAASESNLIDKGAVGRTSATQVD